MPLRAAAGCAGARGGRGRGDGRGRPRSTSTPRPPSSSTSSTASARGWPGSILEYRKEHGGFGSVEELGQVPGDRREAPRGAAGEGARVRWRAAAHAWLEIAREYPRHVVLFALAAGLALGPVSPPATVLAAGAAAAVAGRRGLAALAAGAVLLGAVVADARLAALDAGVARGVATASAGRERRRCSSRCGSTGATPALASGSTASAKRPWRGCACPRARLRRGCPARVAGRRAVAAGGARRGGVG